MILVTGGAGYIGSHTVKQLLKQRYEVVIFDNLSEGHRELVLADHFVEGDLLDTDALRNVFAQYPINAVIHFAALSKVGESVKDPQKYYANNVVGTLNLLHAMHEHEVDLIVFSSSAAVYGNPRQDLIREEHPKEPISPYGQTKWMTENMMEDFAHAYDLRYVALRYFNAAGADPDGEIGEWHVPATHLIPIVLEAALGERPHMKIFGTDYDTPDGTCIRDYIHVSDLADAHVLALEHSESVGHGSVYNLGTGCGHSVREIVDACQEISGRSIPVIEGSRRPGDPPRLVADPALSQQKLGWKPKKSDLETIVKTALSWQLSRNQRS